MRTFPIRSARQSMSTVPKSNVPETSVMNGQGDPNRIPALSRTSHSLPANPLSEELEPKERGSYDRRLLQRPVYDIVDGHANGHFPANLGLPRLSTLAPYYIPANTGRDTDQLAFGFGTPGFSQVPFGFGAGMYENVYASRGPLSWGVSGSSTVPGLANYPYDKLSFGTGGQSEPTLDGSHFDLAKRAPLPSSQQSTNEEMVAHDTAVSSTQMMDPPEVSLSKPISPLKKADNELRSAKPKRGRPKKGAAFPVFKDVVEPESSPPQVAAKPTIDYSSDIEDQPQDYSNTPLAYGNQLAAWKGCMQNLVSCNTAWMPPKNDTSIPGNDEERKDVVRKLLGAMLDTSQCKDSGGKTFVKRWGSGTSPYDVRDMEKVCWDIELLAERMHKEGPHILSIYDPTFLKLVKRTKNYSFGDRIGWLVRLLSSFKSRVDSFMKGDSLMHTVAAPQEAYSSARSNLTQNKKRQHFIDSGKKAEKLAEGFSNTNRAPTTPHRNAIIAPDVLARIAPGDCPESSSPPNRLLLDSSPTNPQRILPPKVDIKNVAEVKMSRPKRVRGDEEQTEIRQLNNSKDSQKRSRA